MHFHRWGLKDHSSKLTNKNAICRHDVPFETEKGQTLYTIVVVIYNMKKDNDTIKYLESNELRLIFDSAENDRDYLIIWLLFDSGMRVNELVTTRVADVDLDQRFIRIQAERTKTKQARSPRISGYTRELLNTYIEEHGLHKDEWLFPGQKPGQHLSTKTVRRIVDRAAVTAGLQVTEPRNKVNRKRIGPHTLRHSHAVAALTEGVALHDLQRQLGHSKLATTEIYTRVAPVHTREAYDRVGFGQDLGEKESQST